MRGRFREGIHGTAGFDRFWQRTLPLRKNRSGPDVTALKKAILIVMLLEGEGKFIEGGTSGKSGRGAALGAEGKKGNGL